MGIEYALRFRHPGPTAVVNVLGTLPVLRRTGSGLYDFELRAEGSTGGMPDASCRIEADGMSFCHYGGSGRAFLGEVVARLVSKFGPVTITEIE